MREVAWVCGGLDYKDRARVETELHRFFTKPGGIILTGGADGADMLAFRAAQPLGHHPMTVPYFRPGGRAGGPMRNQVCAEVTAAMLHDGHQVVVLAFGGDRGTADALRHARRYDLPIREFDRDNEEEHDD